MANAKEAINFKTCFSCNISYQISFVKSLDNCKHDICKVCLYDDNHQSGSKTCSACQTPISDWQIETIFKHLQDASFSVPDTCYDKVYQSAGGILVRKIDGVLHYLAILQKRFNQELQWVSPKGRIEGDETSLDAAKREIFEEVGLKSITLIDFVFKQCYCYTEMDKQYKKSVFWYLFSTDEPKELKLNEEEGFVESRWLTYEESLNIFTHKTFTDIIKMVDLILKK